MRAGMQGLGLAPEAFWRLTPAELAFLLGRPAIAAPMARERLDALLARFPDAAHETKEDGDAIRSRR